MDSKYKVGDLIVLSDFGRLVMDDNKRRVALVVEGPEYVTYPLSPRASEEPVYFWSYTIMIADELITGVPQEFLDRMVMESEEDEK